MSKPIVFIVIDSVRFYKTDVDDRGRLSYMDEFSKYSVEFTNAITSAPSSVMAAATMFTGIESAYLARNYNDWEFDTKNFISLQNTLKDNGYKIFSIDNSRTGREVTKDLTQPLSKKYFPVGISHSNFWTNIEMISILENIFLKKPPKKSFFMLWFDCRNDPNTSYCVEKTIQILKKNDFYNNSTIVMTSDHGYPDPSTGLNVNTMRNMRHDMVVTDDNIKVPLLIKTPDNQVGKVKDIVGHVDLMPTILNLVNIDLPKKNKSLLNGVDIIKNKEKLDSKRIIRSDTRLLLQKGRITSLRNNILKYVIYHDEKKEELYDLVNDPNELKPILSFENYNIENFKNYLMQSNLKINTYHNKYINIRIQYLEKVFNKYSKNNKNYKILLFGKFNYFIFAEIITYFKKNSNFKFFILEKTNLLNKFSSVSKIDTNTIENFNCGLYITEKKHYSFDNPKIFKKYSKKCNKILCADFNLSFYNRFIVRWLNPVLKYRRNFFFYKDEPKLIIYDLIRLLKNFYLVYFRKQITINPDMLEVKQLRDRAFKANLEKKILVANKDNEN